MLFKSIKERRKQMSKQKAKQLVAEALDYIQGYLVGSNIIYCRIDIKKAKIRLINALKELEKE